MSKSAINKNKGVRINQARQRGFFVPFLLLVLVAAVAVQGWYMYEMKQQLDQVTASNKQNRSSTATVSQKPAVSSPPSQPQATLAPPATTPPAGNNTLGNSPGANNAPPPAHRIPFDDPFLQRDFTHRADRLDPYEEIERMRREMDAMMRDAFRRHDNYYAPNNRQGTTNRNTPDGMNMSISDFNIEDKGDGYLVKVNIPGADKNNINVSVKDQTLSVSGEQQQTRERTDDFGNILYQQQQRAAFKRSMTLPEPVKPGSLKTRFKGDTLEIMVMKAS
jgi:HSP20 family protein